MDKDLITLIGIIVSFIVGGLGLIISVLNSRRTIFINSITSSRIKYIQDIRNSISEYCGLFYRYKILLDNDSKMSKEKYAILETLDKLKYQIMLFLNPEDKIWDKKMIKLIEFIRENLNNNPEKQIEELILITQYLLKLEWENAKLESQSGPISKKKKSLLNKKYLEKFETHRQRKIEN